MTIAQSIRELQRSIHDAATDSNHPPAGLRLVLVTKTVEPARILEAYQAGVRDFGENRVQEWQEKKERLPQDIRWHLIGHLQTNKVKHVVGRVHLIHSLDRIELADEIERQARARGVSEVPCLLQVNMSGEDTKSGTDPESAAELVSALEARPTIKLKGLMTIGPLGGDKARIRECFHRTRELFETLREEYPRYPLEILSMGMSSDYKIAIEEGANMLRIGSLIFPRDPSGTPGLPHPT